MEPRPQRKEEGAEPNDTYGSGRLDERWLPQTPDEQKAVGISGPLVPSGSLEERSLGASVGRWGFTVALFGGIFQNTSPPAPRPQGV